MTDVIDQVAPIVHPPIEEIRPETAPAPEDREVTLRQSRLNEILKDAQKAVLIGLDLRPMMLNQFLDDALAQFLPRGWHANDQPNTNASS